MASPFVDQIGLLDPRDRLAAMLSALDDAIAAARTRKRAWGGNVYPDPDTHAITKCVELAAKMLSEYHARAQSTVESIGTADRQQAIAELRAVLAAWEDPMVTDEQWRASRAPVAEMPVQKLRPGVVRRLKA